MSASNDSRKTVFVGLSGGVDSSVAALRLKRSGYRVVGVFIKVWQPDFLSCNWEGERLDAMRVAAKLNIPFRTFDAVDVYKNQVADYMVGEYKAGRTPNPDAMCNQHVKFGAFLDFAKREGADCIATGHYAQVKETDGMYELHRGRDTQKDQTYFLWTLTQHELSKTLFPIGDTQKENIRKEAERAGLTTAAKKDSQGVCFLGQLDMDEFLGHYIEKKEGAVLDEGGKVVGTHHGVWFYTIGQRHGFSLADNAPHVPLYVVKKDLETNTLYVSHELPTYERTTLKLTSVNQQAKLKVGQQLSVVTRYREKPVTATVLEVGSLTLSIENSVSAPTEGQSCVFYDGTRCLGGGIIDDIDHE